MSCACWLVQLISLCSASNVGYQRDAAHICCWALCCADALNVCCRFISPASVVLSSKPLHFSHIGSIDSPLSSSITPSLFHSSLNTFLFCKSFPPWPSIFSFPWLTPQITWTVYRYFWVYPFLLVFHFSISVFGPCGRLNWLVSFWADVKISSRIVSMAVTAVDWWDSQIETDRETDARPFHKFIDPASHTIGQRQ